MLNRAGNNDCRMFGQNLEVNLVLAGLLFDMLSHPFVYLGMKFKLLVVSLVVLT